MNYFSATLYLVSLFLLFTSCTPDPETHSEDPDKEVWEYLFNGKNLDGWDLKITGRDLNENYLNTIQIEDSMLRVKYDEYENFGTNFGHLYYEKPFSYYKFRFEYRFLGEQTPGGATWNVRNSGVMFHSQSAASLEYDQTFPVSIELQLLGGLGTGPRPTGNLCTPGTMVEWKDTLTRQHCLSSDSETYEGDQWVAAEAVVLGDSIVHHLIEGDTVLTYMKPQIDRYFINENNDWVDAGVTKGAEWAKRDGELLSSGYIALQAESHPIDFKNIRLLNLEGCMDPKAVNYKSYYLKSAPEMCRYE